MIHVPVGPALIAIGKDIVKTGHSIYIEQLQIKPVIHLVPFTTNLIWAHDLERIAIEHCDNMLSAGPNSPHPPSPRNLHKGCQSGSGKDLDCPESHQGKEVLHHQSWKSLLERPIRSHPHNPCQHCWIKINHNYRSCPPKWNRWGNPRSRGKFDAAELIWGTGAHGTAVAGDMLSPEFRSYLTRLIHDSCRTNTRVKCRSMEKSALRIHSCGSIVYILLSLAL